MWKFSKSYELYGHNLLFIRWLADFCGVDMMVENYKMNYRTISTLATIAGGIFCSMYSCVFYYPDWMKILEVLIPVSFLIQGAIKFYNGYMHRHFFMMMYGRIERLHYKNRNHERNNASLLLLMKRIHILTKVIGYSYIGLGFIYASYPLFVYWIQHERVLMLAVRIPFIDAETYKGYFVTTTVQVIMVILGMTGVAAADTAILLFVASLAGYADVFKNDLKELSEILNSDFRDEEGIRTKVRMICVQHQDVIEYESDLDERYIVTCLVQVLASVICITVALVLIHLTQFLPAYAACFIGFSQLLEFCLLGTILTVKNEEISEAIYGAYWYLMDTPERNCFSLMLHKSQNFVEMTVGGFAPLNIETFVAIMNKIYSCFMMMINFVE